MPQKISVPIRLALRVEGENWNAYAAEPDSMKDAIFLGSIAMGFVVKNPKRKDQFAKLMADCIADYIQEIVGERPTMETRPAPESERSGNA